MAHNHSHNHSDNAQKNISVAFFLNLIFAFIELVGGLMTNSIAILSDALHDFGDCISLGIAYVLQRKSNNPADNKFTYGYKRFSLLGSVFLSAVLVISSTFILIEAGKRLFEPQMVDAKGMLFLAILGIIVNGAAALRLRRGITLNERAVFLHIMEDVLSWIAILVASIVMMFVHLPILDSILSIGIAIWVLTNVYKNLRSTFKVMLQASPEGVDIELVKSEIETLPNVESIHDLHIWSQDGNSHVMTLHLVTNVSETTTLKESIRNLAKKHNILHTTIEFERRNTECEYMDCGK